MASESELTQRAADLVGIEDDTMTWSGTDYVGTYTELTKSDTAEVGGFERRYDASFYVRTGLFSGARPNVDDEVTVGSKTFKIVAVHEYPDDIAIELELRSASGG